MRGPERIELARRHTLTGGLVSLFALSLFRVSIRSRFSLVAWRAPMLRRTDKQWIFRWVSNLLPHGGWMNDGSHAEYLLT
jgi:hypothetical protein